MSAQFPDEQSNGEFQRQEDAFREWITTDGSSSHPAKPDRYHLYVSLACPWAHRTMIVRKLKGLEHIVGMTVVDPIRNEEQGWKFSDAPGCSPDPVKGFEYLKEAYLMTDPDYAGRVSVPVLWDKKTNRIVNNSEDDIMRMFNSAFDAHTDSVLDLYPEQLRAEIDRLNDLIYDNVNNGVYRAGFATSQKAYEDAVYPLFDTLDGLEARLARSRYLIGDQITETDVKLFVTLIRFDPVYHGHFKCNLRRIVDYRALSRFMIDLYRMDGISETVDFDHIKRHYYMTHDDINPTGIVPAGPEPLVPHPRLRTRTGRKGF